MSEVALQSAIMGTWMVWPQLNTSRHRETVVSGLDVIMCGNYTLRRHVYVAFVGLGLDFRARVLSSV